MDVTLKGFPPIAHMTMEELIKAQNERLKLTKEQIAFCEFWDLHPTDAYIGMIRVSHKNRYVWQTSFSEVIDMAADKNTYFCSEEFHQQLNNQLHKWLNVIMELPEEELKTRVLETNVHLFDT